MGTKKFQASVAKYHIAKQLAGENASEDDVVKYYWDPALAKVIAKYCSNGLFSFLSESSKEHTNIIREFPVISNYGLSLDDFKKATKRVERFRKINLIMIIGMMIVTVGYFLFSKATLSIAGYIYDFIAVFFVGSVVTGVFFELLRILYLHLSPLVQRCIRYCRAIRDYSMGQFDYWQNLSWREFEKEVAILLSNLGIAAEVTKGTGDKGVDINATFGRKKIVVQCKKHKAQIGPGIVRELLGTHVSEDADMGIIISMSGFSTAAHEAASERILLLELRDLLQLDKNDFQAMLSRMFRHT